MSDLQIVARISETLFQRPQVIARRRHALLARAGECRRIIDAYQIAARARPADGAAERTQAQVRGPEAETASAYRQNETSCLRKRNSLC